MSDVVVLSDAYLTDPCWVSRHYLPVEAARRHRVLYVEQAPAIVTPLRYPSQVKSWLRWCATPRRISERLTVYSPPPRLPLHSGSAAISRFNQAWKSVWIRRAVRRAGFDAPILWVFDHQAAAVMRAIPAALKFYHAVDDIEHFPWRAKRTEIIRGAIAASVAEAHLVVVSSRPLERQFAAHGRPTFYLPHGVNVEAYKDPHRATPKDLSTIPPPIIGFVGKLESWVDFDLIARVASLRPQYTFALVGPIVADISALSRLSNVRCLGLRPRGEIPGYLMGMQAGMIPFRLNALTHSVNPVKLYEYFAAGIPVVSVPLPEVERFGDHVRVARTPQEFAAAIDACLVEPPVVAAQRRELAERNSWSDRARELEMIWSRFLEAASRPAC